MNRARYIIQHIAETLGIDSAAAKVHALPNIPRGSQPRLGPAYPSPKPAWTPGPSKAAQDQEQHDKKSALSWDSVYSR